jgi:hypothetical protein
VRSNRTALYLQDTWTINDRVSLRPGLRFERFQANGFGGPTLWDNKVVAPRFGGTISLDARKDNLFKFHWGRYYAAFSTGYVDRVYAAWSQPIVTYLWYNAASPVFDPQNPATWPSISTTDPNNVLASSAVTQSALAPGTREPYTDETTFALEHRFDEDWHATVTWVYRQQKDIVVHKNTYDDPSNPATGSYVNDTFTDYRVDPSGNTQTPYTYWQSAVNPSAYTWLICNEPSAKRNYVAGTLVVDRKYRDGWSLSASFTRSNRYGNMDSADGYDVWNPYESPNFLVNSYGKLPGFNDYEGKVRGMVGVGWGLRLSANFTYLSGQHFTPFVRTPLDTFGNHSYEYLEPRGSETYPSEHLLDMRLARDFPFAGRSSLEVFAQVFNVLNEGTTLAYVSERANSSGYGVPGTVEQGRRLELGLRYSF